MPRNYPGIGIQIPEVLLPAPQIDLAKWAVIACDQFTSQPGYWQAVRDWVGDSPSTLNLILPEAFMHNGVDGDEIRCIHISMEQYLAKGYLRPVEGMIYVERVFDGQVRQGLIFALDLEQYGFKDSNFGLIRATEKTIQERLEMRLEVRQGSVLELPHILALIDDPDFTVIEPVAQEIGNLEKLYDVELMMNSGHLKGWMIHDLQVEKGVVKALENLAQPAVSNQRLGGIIDPVQLLFAVGDGNHSVAAAKVLWDQLKQQPGIPENHPGRFVLVEVQNLHAEALSFEPIHRVLFGLKTNIIQAVLDHFKGKITLVPCDGESPMDELVSQVNQTDEGQAFGVITAQGIQVVKICKPDSSLVVSSVQTLLDSLSASSLVERIDYVHGADVVFDLGKQTTNAGLYLPPITKDILFQTITTEGVLPLKSFSIGEARQKRFYMESRKIVL